MLLMTVFRLMRNGGETGKSAVHAIPKNGKKDTTVYLLPDTKPGPG
jgi:hypothetical protein